MIITLNIIFEKLKLDYLCEKNRRALSDKALSTPLLYTRGQLLPECLYVADADELCAEEIEGLSVVCVGTPNFDYWQKSFDLITVEKSCDLKTLFNRIQMLFISLHEWDAQLKNASRNCIDMQKLLEVSRRELDFSFIFLNRFFKPIAICNGENEDITPYDQHSEPLSSILMDTGVASVERHQKACPFYNETHNKKGLYYNVYYNSHYRGKLLAICDRRTEINRAHESLFENVCQHAEKMFEHFSASSMRSPVYVSMQKMLLALLSDNQLSRSRVLSTLKFVHWDANDTYVVCYIPFDEKGSVLLRAEYIVSLLENRWSVIASDFCAQGIVLKEGVVWVMNTARSANVDFDTFLPDFFEQMKGFIPKIGMSARCHDIFSLNLYLQQAIIAISIGSRINPEAMLYSFTASALEHMLDCAVGPFNMEDVLHPSLMILEDYDRENNSEYYKTLRMFIRCNYNALQASNELFIHRSTFAVRIKRIETRCNIDLDDEHTRLHILMSFYIKEKLRHIRRRLDAEQ